MDHLPLDPVVVPNTFRDRIHRFSRLQIQSDGSIRLLSLLLQSNNSVLHIESSVRSESLGNDEHCLGERLDTKLLSSFCADLACGLKVLGTGDLECTSTGDKALVLNSVLDGSETVSEGVLDLRHGVGIGACRSALSPIKPGKLTLDEHGDRVWLLDVLDKSVLLLTERVLVDQSRPSKDIRCQVIDRVLRNTADTQLQPGLVS